MLGRRTRIIALCAPAVSLLAAGCGGGGGSPGVANLASPPAQGTTTTTQGGPASSGKPTGPSGAPSGQFQIGMMVGTTDGPKFSACMRKHGITNFPDPDGNGVVSIHSGMGIDPGSPAFQSARDACDKLLPNGGQPTPAQIAQRQKEMLAFSACMRAHGIKDFPDPSNGGLRVSVQPGGDPNNPTFQKAQQACRKDLPFKGVGLKGG